MAAQLSKILIVSDAVASTGLARVTEAIFRPLCARYELFQLGSAYLGDPHDWPWPIFPAIVGGDPRGVGRINEVVERVAPDIIFLYNDFEYIIKYVVALLSREDLPKIVIYCPIDGGPVYPEELMKLHGVNKFVVCTAFARDMVEKSAQEVRRILPDFAFPAVDVIPHGVDTDTFYPLVPGSRQESLRSAREQLFPENDLAKDNAFIILNGNRNQGRKRIDITVHAFSQFVQNKPDHVLLYLHMGNETYGWDIPKLVRRYGVADRVMLSCESDALPRWPVEKLNLLYNACDVGVNTSTSEGWGLVSLEHAATGAAQIVPNHSACSELWEDAAILVDPVVQITHNVIEADGWFVHPNDVADAFETLYSDRQLLAHLAERAVAVANQKALDWGNIAVKWAELFAAVEPC